MICIACGKPIEAGDYRLIGLEQITWESRYAHRGTCETEARERFAPPKATRPRAPRRAPKVEVEELTMDAPDPFPEEEPPWFGMELRRP